MVSPDGSLSFIHFSYWSSQLAGVSGWATDCHIREESWPHHQIASDRWPEQAAKNTGLFWIPKAWLWISLEPHISVFVADKATSKHRSRICWWSPNEILTAADNIVKHYSNIKAVPDGLKLSLPSLPKYGISQICISICCSFYECPQERLGLADQPFPTKLCMRLRWKRRDK